MRHWKIIGAAIALLGEVALQISGFTSPPLAIALAVICIGLFLWSVWPMIKRIRFQVPIRLQSLEQLNKPATSQGSKFSGPTQDEIAERLVFIQKLRAVARRLLKNAQISQTHSVTSIICDLDEEVSQTGYTAKETITNQAFHLLGYDLGNLLTQTGNFQSSTEELSTTTLDDANIHSICNTTRNLVIDYRRLVDESCTLLKNLEDKGVGSYWTKPPWSVRIQKELADNYDELMRLVIDLRASTPQNYQDLLPNDDHLRKFPRLSLLA
jgi:hypothetical protein